MTFTALGATLTSALELKTLNYLITSKLEDNSTLSGIVSALLIAMCVIIPYLLGSINPAIIFSKIFFHDDVRSHGSGNAGTTNVLRTYGKKMAILTFGCDFLKAAISVVLGSFMYGKTIGGAIAGLFVIIGHMFPLYYKFKGGKGVACAVAVVLILEPITFACLFVIFAIIVIGTRYVSLASCMSIGLYPVIVSAFENIYKKAFNHNLGLIPATAVVIAVLVIYMHRANLKRLYEGKESKVSLGKKKEKAEPVHTEPVTDSGKKYTDEDFCVCECGRLIPITRNKCIYCGKANPEYVKGKKNK